VDSSAENGSKRRSRNIISNGSSKIWRQAAWQKWRKSIGSGDEVKRSGENNVAAWRNKVKTEIES